MDSLAARRARTGTPPPRPSASLQGPAGGSGRAARPGKFLRPRTPDAFRGPRARKNRARLGAAALGVAAGGGEGRGSLGGLKRRLSRKAETRTAASPRSSPAPAGLFSALGCLARLGRSGALSGGWGGVRPSIHNLHSTAPPPLLLPFAECGPRLGGFRRGHGSSASPPRRALARGSPGKARPSRGGKPLPHGSRPSSGEEPGVLRSASPTTSEERCSSGRPAISG